MRKNESGDKGRVKLRIVEFELEGNDSTLQESLRGITAVMNRVAGVAPTKRVEVLSAGTRSAPKNSNGHIEDGAEPVVEVGEEETADEGSESVPASALRRRPTTYPQPKILSDIDFNAADQPLKKYMEEKKPKSHNMKFLAVTAWFAEHGHVDNVTADHVYTAYRAMEWKSRKNMMQPFYFLKDKGWVKATAEGWAITHIGLDKAKELPAGE